jgi:hypothetical protein
MPIADNQTKKNASLSLEEQSQKVAELYNTGTNCDKAVLLILQEILNLPPEKWEPRHNLNICRCPGGTFQAGFKNDTGLPERWLI